MSYEPDWAKSEMICHIPVKRSQMDRRTDGLTDHYRAPAELSPNKLSICINNYIEGSRVTILYTSPTPAFHVLVGINMQISPLHDYHLQIKSLH